ncbi:MAG: hypothetical protein JXB23_04430 [Candidatus Aminicenantes bacterium]|nr:hypothetical protein [Candidatus Aminicenantes bacterium]
MGQKILTYELGISETEAKAKFDALQQKLKSLWNTIDHMNQDEQTIVVVPSISVDVNIPGPLLQAYEERFLFLLLLLRQPRARLVYVTSQAIPSDIVDYYLHLLPGVISSHARKRLFMLSPLDGSSCPLSLKLLQRPRLLQKIRSLIPDHDRAHLVPFMNTILERDLALKLNIPMYGADPKFFSFGTKSSCRKLFAQEGVNHPFGVGDVRTVRDLVAAIVDIRNARPSVGQVIVKHDEGVGGMGNAVLDLDGLPKPGSPGEPTAIEKRLSNFRFEVPEVTSDWYLEILAEHGGVVEERILGEEFRSPSAQIRITPLGEVELLSTHDQILGGPSGQSYFGARFPADEAYASTIMREAAKVGKRLAEEGVIGRLAVDFVAVRSNMGDWESYAIEINLRKGGTTHPFLTLQFLTDGTYDAQAGLFKTAEGNTKYFAATDHLESPLYRVFTHEDIFDIAAFEGLHFNQAHQTGVVFHMMSALGEYGRLGLTAVGDSHAEADDLQQKTIAALDRAAERALK